MNFTQMTLDEAKTLADAPPPKPTYSAQIVAAHLAECPAEPQFKPSHRQIKAVWDVMKTGAWFTKAEIAAFARVTEHGVSARLSDIKREFGVLSEKRKMPDSSLYQYRLVLPGAHAEAQKV